ncbi:MAG TPA: hypothetical protein VMY18_07325 [Acidobacteriota bacterium]|nr:hypothetical protein [Acidobacteriota bacterium]
MTSLEASTKNASACPRLGARELVSLGATVIVAADAGIEASFRAEDYRQAGARIAYHFQVQLTCTSDAKLENRRAAHSVACDYESPSQGSFNNRFGLGFSLPPSFRQH